MALGPCGGSWDLSYLKGEPAAPFVVLGEQTLEVMWRMVRKTWEAVTMRRADRGP